VGRGGLHKWPPWSPDLNSQDFHVWGYLKNMVDERKVGAGDLTSEFSMLQDALMTPQLFVTLHFT
jgi:hypothetical protein